MLRDRNHARLRCGAASVALALLAGAALTPAVAPAASFAKYRISIAGSYGGEGPTKVSCLHDVAQPDGSTQQESYTVNGSASERVSVHTIKPATVTVFFGGGGFGGHQLQANGSPTAGRVAVKVRRANVSPPDPCLRDPLGPPAATAGCGTRSLTLRGEPLINARGSGLGAKVSVFLALENARTFSAPDDPFLRRPSDLFPQCLLPDGQVFFADAKASDNCGTVKASKDPTAHRFFSGSKRIELSKTVSGHGFKTDGLGRLKGTNRGSCGTSSTYTLKLKLTLVRTSLVR